MDIPSSLNRAFLKSCRSHITEDDEKVEKINPLKRAYNKTYWVWIVIIGLDLIFQCLRSANMRDDREDFISKSMFLYQKLAPNIFILVDNAETVVTIVLAIEICLRIGADWRNFHRSRRNWFDLGLAVITAIIQLPSIRQSKQTYAWLTFFQIVRIYRVVLAVPLTRDLIVSFSSPTFRREQQAQAISRWSYLGMLPGSSISLYLCSCSLFSRQSLPYKSIEENSHLQTPMRTRYM